MIRRGYAQAAAGNPRLLMSMAADDVEFVFPGHNSFAATLRGKEPLAAWLERFASLQPQFHVQDVLVSGPPWNMRIGVRFQDAIGEDYRNEGMEYLRVRGARVRSVEVFLDTEVISAWEQQHPELVA
ncbi:MAG: nuclear transport factor 2 family protein [Acidimicrobiaceae bacterium]|nr:nuclear transport factor 2 family protein [Acidimicrobiaceae bacterium]